MKQDKFFDQPVQKKHSLSQLFSDLSTGLRKSSMPTNMVTESLKEKPLHRKFSLSSLLKKDMMSSNIDDLNLPNIPKSLVPRKDDEIAQPVGRKGSFSAFMGPLVSPRNLFSRERKTSDGGSPRGDVPKYSNEKQRSMSLSSSLPIMDLEKTKKLVQHYRYMSPEKVISEEKVRYNLKNEFSPMLIIQTIERSRLKQTEEEFPDVTDDWESVIQIVHVDDIKQK